MKIFVSYRYTGEDLQVLKVITENICNSLHVGGYKSFCSFGKNDFYVLNKFTYKQLLEDAFSELDSSDYVLAFVKSQEKSEGMLLELGYAAAKKKKIILAIKSGVVTTFIHELAEKVIEFEELDELYGKLKNLKLD